MWNNYNKHLLKTVDKKKKQAFKKYSSHCTIAHPAPLKHTSSFLLQNVLLKYVSSSINVHSFETWR